MSTAEREICCSDDRRLQMLRLCLWRHTCLRALTQRSKRTWGGQTHRNRMPSSCHLWPARYRGGSRLSARVMRHTQGIRPTLPRRALSINTTIRILYNTMPCGRGPRVAGWRAPRTLVRCVQVFERVALCHSQSHRKDASAHVSPSMRGVAAAVSSLFSSVTTAF